MDKGRGLLIRMFVWCAVGLTATACSQMDSAVKNDPLVSPDAAPKDIYTAAETGDLARVRQIIDSGNWDYSEMDSRGMRPLDCAIKGGNPEIVKLMVEHGADVNAPGPEGTPLQAAQKAGKKDVEQVLVEHGARQ